MSSAGNTITTGRRSGGRQFSRSWRLWLLIAAATLAATAALLVHRAVGSSVVLAPAQVTTTTGAERAAEPGRRLVQINDAGREAPAAPATSRGPEYN